MEVLRRIGLLCVGTLVVLFALSHCDSAGAESPLPPEPPSPTVHANAGGPYRALVTDPQIVFSAEESVIPGGVSVSFHWDFGDGSSGSGQSPTHLYDAQVAQYSAVLVLRDQQNVELSRDTARVRVRERPEARFEVLNVDSLEIGTPVVFDASESVDDGLGYVAAFHWDFDYDGSFSPTRVSANDQVSHIFTTPGAYSVALMVEDDDGFSSLVVHVPIEMSDRAGARVSVE